MQCLRVLRQLRIEARLLEHVLKLLLLLGELLHLFGQVGELFGELLLLLIGELAVLEFLHELRQGFLGRLEVAARQRVGKVLGRPVGRCLKLLQGGLDGLGSLALLTVDDVVEALVQVGELFDRVAADFLARLERVGIGGVRVEIAQQVGQLFAKLGAVENRLDDRLDSIVALTDRLGDLGFVRRIGGKQVLRLDEPDTQRNRDDQWTEPPAVRRFDGEPTPDLLAGPWITRGKNRVLDSRSRKRIVTIHDMQSGRELLTQLEPPVDVHGHLEFRTATGRP